MTTPSHVMIGHGLVDLDHLSFRWLEGCQSKWEISSNLINWTLIYHELSPDSICKLCCRSIACVVAPLCFDLFLEKTKLKHDSSNDADWVRDLRIILIVGQKTYVLDAPLGDMTCCRSRCRCYERLASSIWRLLDSLVHHALRLRTGTSKNIFEMSRSIWDVPRVEISISDSCPCRKVWDLWHFAYKMEENSSASEHVLRMSRYYNRLNQVGVNLPDKIVIDRVH